MNREERVAIMVVDGGCTADEAERYCDAHPQLYGIRDVESGQQSLFGANYEN